jgi:hypothetical protein
MRAILSLFTLAVLHLTPNGLRADVTMTELFHEDEKRIELALGAERFKRLQEAVEDFNAVLNFKRPIHAKVDKDAAVPADGGTHYYVGNGYRLTWVQSWFELRNGADANQSRNSALSGFMFGPILKLEGFGGLGEVSSVSFYPSEKLAKLLKLPKALPFPKIPGLPPPAEPK